MFYSHSYLAKKSPLGTVWMAAHLQRRIKKPQIDGVDIPSYADCIMFPEVPLALRLSSHLLLGLVRIYSWKVNYLFQDCNRMLTDIRTRFASVQVNLPVDADRAPFESVTLPDTFELDAVQLDESIYQTEGHDNHLRTYEEITLTDQIPVEDNLYVAFYINEDNRVDPSPQPENSKDGGVLEEHGLQAVDGLDATTTPLENLIDIRGAGPRYQEDSFFQGLNEGRFSDDFQEIEVMRDAVNNFEPVISPVWDDTNTNNDTMNRKDSLSPVMESESLFGIGLLPALVHERQPTAALLDNPDILNTGRSLDFIAQPVPEFELQPSPPVEKQKARKKRKKLFFDETLVLTNADMKKQLEDASKLVGKRRKLPCSALDAWRFHKALKKENVFHEALLSGMCANLQQVSEKSFPLLSVDSTPVEASPGISNVRSRDDMLDIDMAPEQARSETHINVSLPDMMPSPSGRGEFTPTDAVNIASVSDIGKTVKYVREPTLEIHIDVDMEPERARFETHINESLPDMMPSPSGRGEFTPVDAGNLSSVSDIGKTVEYDREPTLEIPTSAGPVAPELETPLLLSDERLMDDTVPEIPGLLNSPNSEEVNFLDSINISSGHDADSIGNMSARTRAVAQYLKEYSPSTKVLKDQPGNLSLNKILKGRKRNQCARMFFETLVTVLTFAKDSFFAWKEDMSILWKW